MGGVLNWNEPEQRIGTAVKLPRRPVAFVETAPANVERFSRREPILRPYVESAFQSQYL